MLSSLFRDTTDEKAMSLYTSLVDKCMRKNKLNILYSDDGSKDFSAYSTDSESSEDPHIVTMLMTADIVLSPPKKVVAPPTVGFQLNPWGHSGHQSNRI